MNNTTITTTPVYTTILGNRNEPSRRILLFPSLTLYPHQVRRNSTPPTSLSGLSLTTSVTPQIMYTLEVKSYQEWSNSNLDTCPICTDSLCNENHIIKTKCCHFFCKECLFEWSKNSLTCPVCRDNI